MNIAKFSIKHKVAVLLAFLLIVAFGVQSFSSLPLALMPDMELPVALVMTTYIGAGPEEIENLVTKEIEDTCAGVSGVDELTSLSSENLSLVMIQFTDGTDLDGAVDDLKDKIDRVERSLPDDADTPMVLEMDMDAAPILTIALEGDDLASLQTLADDTVVPYLERIEGVSSVDVMGGYEYEIAVNTYADRMEGYGLTVSYIAQILSAENISVPAGSIDSGSQSFSVTTDGEYDSVEDVENALIPLPTGGTVRLGDIADVGLAPEDRDAIAKFNNEECVLLSIYKQSDANIVTVCERVKEQLAALGEEMPELHYDAIIDQSEFINLSIDTVIQNIVIGVVLAAVVLFLFLRAAGPAITISLSMPICIISVFLIMQVMDITMNIMSLGGLALGVGMIVDNSIVVLENIYRFRGEGKTRYEACVEGAQEVTGSVVGSTMTTLAVFVPIGLMDGLMGMMLGEFALTIAALIASSMLVALFLVPILCYLTMDRNTGKSGRIHPVNTGVDLMDKPLIRKYRSALKFCITRRKTALLVMAGVMAGFVVLIGGSIAVNGVIMMPDMDQGELTVEVEMPIGSELYVSEAMADRICAIVEEAAPEYESISYSVSSGGVGIGSTSGNSFSVSVALVDKDERDRSTEEVVEAVREELRDVAGAEISVSTSGSMDMSSMTGDDIDVALKGDDYELLTETASRLAEEIKKLPDAVDVSSSASDRVPGITVSLNREIASQLGLTAGAVGSTVRQQITGADAAEVRMNGEEITITVRGDSDSYTSIDAIKSIQISTGSGGSVPLSMVADVAFELEPQSIRRTNQTREVSVTGTSLSGNVTELNQEVREIMETFELPEGVSYSSEGTSRIDESMGDLVYSLTIALCLVYFVLAAQYESFLLPIMIMAILPISLLGAMGTLPLFGQAISVVSLVGVIVLAGTVVNSSIVLVEYIITRREMGESREEAILNACPLRIRPIMMTTLTTVLGLLPTVLSNGEGSEMMRPMAIVMIGGMLISVVVTLLLTPTLYIVFDNLSEWFRRKRGADE